MIGIFFYVVEECAFGVERSSTCKTLESHERVFISMMRWNLLGVLLAEQQLDEQPFFVSWPWPCQSF